RDWSSDVCSSDLVGQVLDLGDGRGLVELVAGLAGDFLGNQFRHALDVDRGARRPGPFGDGLSHGFDMTVGRVVENQYFRHVKSPFLRQCPPPGTPDRKSTRLNSSHVKKSYAVFCLKRKTRRTPLPTRHSI